MNVEKRNWLHERIDTGLKTAVAAALEEHRRAGRLVAIFRNGEVVLVHPEPHPVAASTAPSQLPPTS